MKNTSKAIIIFILFMVQFIDVLDFMVVMPLGPDFALSLGIEESKLGWFAASYALSAAFTGIMSSTIIDRFERKKILIITLVGLIFSNIFSANAWSFESLLTSRFLAGAFGGPATSICFAIIADIFEGKNRGAAMGKVMGGFSLAAVFGVPIGLKMSELYGWYASFYFVAIVTVITLVLVMIYLPNLTAHLSLEKKNKVTYMSLFDRKVNVMTFAVAFIGSMAAFMIIPYITAFIQLNLNFPRDKIDYIFFIGGACSFFVMRIAGKFVDKNSSSKITMFSNIFVIFTLLFGFIMPIDSIPILIIFPMFMIGMAIRNVSGYTLYSKIPLASERAGFMSIISCVQHLASSAGSVLASIILVNKTGSSLENMDIVAVIAMILFLITPYMLKNIEKQAMLN
jgi:multidrug resistance protein